MAPTAPGTRPSLRAAASLATLSPTQSPVAKGSGGRRGNCNATLVLAELSTPSSLSSTACPVLSSRKSSLEGALLEEEPKLDPDARVFTITSNPNGVNLSVLRTELERRGFTESPWESNRYSHFNLKWGAKLHVDYDDLKPPQQVDHFQHDDKLTTKSGLANNIKNAIACAGVDPSSFFPVAFHLNTAEAISNFACVYKASKALCVLKDWLAHLDAGKYLSASFPEGVVRVALQVLNRRLLDVDSLLTSENNEGEQLGFDVHQHEWDVLQEIDFARPSMANSSLERQREARLKASQLKEKTQLFVEKHMSEVRSKATRNREMQKEHGFRKAQQFQRSPLASHLRSASSPSLRPDTCNVHEDCASSSHVGPVEDIPQETQGGEEISGQKLTEAVRMALAAARRDPQYNLYRRNLWIMKPAGELRGRGIFVEDDLEKIIQEANKKKWGPAGTDYVCQKYIENPLLIGGSRKHDIRQWVLVTSVNPLKIWFFNECYVRVAANEYQIDDLSDRYTHLTHTIIMCTHPSFDPDDEYWRCQWDQATYSKLLQDHFGKDVWNEKIRPAMKKIVIASLLAVQESLAEPESSKCSFQLFGYDFLVGADLKVWLLEVNDIPMMHASGPVTERLCDACLRETIGLAIDGNHHKHDSELRYHLIYEGAHVTKSRDVAYNSLAIEGKSIKLSAPAGTKIQVSEPAAELLKSLRRRRDQELSEMAERRKGKEERERMDRERRDRLKHALAEKVLARRQSAASESCAGAE